MEHMDLEYSLPIDAVRLLAARHGFQEVQFNETSRVIAFKDETLAVRVNVYYSTGTVATCIFHPGRHQRTQLFRREVSLDQLSDIFANPRVHTGKGYFQVKAADHGPDSHKVGWAAGGPNKAPVHDDVCRWRYVLDSLDFPEQQTQAILAFVRNLTRLFFQDRSVDDGWAGCFFADMWSKWAKKYLKTSVCNDEHGTEARGFCLDCPNSRFMDGKEGEVRKLESQFASLNRDMKSELLVFYLMKTRLSEFPKWVFDSEGHFMGGFLNDVHHDYGTMAYEGRPGICRCHGLI